MVAKLRLYSGLILLFFVTAHLVNKISGLHSFEAMDATSVWTTHPWRTLPGVILIVGSLLIHNGLSLWSLYRRETLKMKGWEATQNIFGLLIPVLLSAHIVGTKLAHEVMGQMNSYAFEMMLFFKISPESGISQALLIILVWIHGCIGLHTWLRLKPGYLRFRNLAVAIAVIFPTLALAGYFAAGMRALAMIDQNPDWMQIILSKAKYGPEIMPWAMNVWSNVILVYVTVLVVLFAARWLRLAMAKRERPLIVSYQGERDLEAAPGATVLEILRANNIPHASVCGGRGRCSTCRVRVGRGSDWLAPANDDENKVLNRISAPEGVRLACQIRPRVDLEVAPLLPASAVAQDGFHKPGYLAGQEVEVVIAFVDLRGSTGLSEGRLPYDFVFILNQFFAAIDRAINDTGGHYAQFNGDGLMAIYGLECDVNEAARQALAGAKAMMQRIEELNRHLGVELKEPLAIGIGIHSGEAIVGSMGPPKHPIISAIGDHVNVAARLEAKCKEYGAPLIVSDVTVQRSGLDLSHFREDTVDVRGREGQITIRIVDDPATMDLGEESEVVAAE
jgi:adenylate cyclase